MINSSSTTVSAELGLRLVAAEQAVVPLVASLHFSGNDPYAIRMAFHVGSEDVQIWPSDPAGSPDEPSPLGVLNIKLSSPFGEAHFEAPAEAIGNFLDRTFRIVPMGRESQVIDIDAELNGLLWQA